MSDEVVSVSEYLLDAASPNVFNLPADLLPCIENIERYLLTTIRTWTSTAESTLTAFSINLIYLFILVIQYSESKSTAVKRISHLSEVRV